MLKKRIIPCLDIKDGRTVKGTNFIGLRDAGDPVELAKKYVLEGADELVFLDIMATVENRATLVSLVKRISLEVNIPFTVGGGIDSIEDAHKLIKAGADKVSINSSAVKNPGLVTAISKELGSQCLVVAIDTKLEEEEWKVYVHGGRKLTTWNTIEWAKKVAQLGAGEILLTSMNNDGTKDGFAIDITAQVSSAVSIPVIASGGAGEKQHFKEVFEKTAATGGLAASIFHYDEVPIPGLKRYLIKEKVSIRI